MAKPLVKININLSKAGFKIVPGTGKNKDKRFVFAEITDEISIDKDNNPIIKLVGWELPTKKGAAPLKLDYEEGKKYTGLEQYPPTIGWCNVGSESGQQQETQPDGQKPPPIGTDDLPF